MDNYLWAGKPSQCVTGRLGNLSFPSYKLAKSSTGLWLGFRWGVFICVGWLGNSV